QVVMLGTAPWQFLPCEDGNYPMCVLYRVDRKTGEVRQLTFEQDSDFTPTVTHDGRVMFTRWEYSDLAHFFARELMTMNPDGVGQLALWGSGTYSPPFFSNARSVPGEPHLVSMFTGGHHCRSELGRFCLCDPTLARAYPFTFDPPDREWTPDLALPMRVIPKVYPKEKTGLVHEFPGYGKDVDGDVCDPFVENQFARGKPYFGYPWPLSAKYHLVNAKTAPDGLVGIYLVDTFDNITLVAEYPEGIYAEPIPFAARKRPPVIPDRSVKGKKTCSVHIADIYNGPGLAGVPRGTAKKLRVFSYHFNYHKTGGHSMTGLDRVESGWDIKRILGTVDIESDGSVCFEMPANTAVSFQPLDGEGRALQLMRSWTVGMPGERVSCTGCHEDNRSSIHTKRTIADEKYFKGEIQQIQPTDGDGLRPWGFANELWPVVVKNCNSCHKLESPEAAYRKLHPYMRRPGPESEIPVLDPLDYHASTSPLIQMLEKGHHGLKLTAADLLKFHEWGDLNVPFFGKWNPPGFQTDRFSMACTNQIARRIALTSRYADITDNPEAEYDRYATLVNKRLNGEMVKSPPAAALNGLNGEMVKSRPSGALNGLNGEMVKSAASQPLNNAEPNLKAEGQFNHLKAEGRSNNLTIPGWPFSRQAAIDGQTGGADDVPQVTVMTLPLGDGVSMTFRRIPAGVYVMGSTAGYPNETQRVVTVTNAFWLGETEVRNDQYHAFDPSHDSRYQDMFGKDHIVPGWIGNHRLMPAVRVSWNRATAFCAWLGRKTGRAARLPTEEEREWAARCGTATPFPWGGLADDYSKYANLADRQVRWSMNEGWDGPGRIRPRKPYKVEQNFPLHDERWTDDAFSLNYVRRALPNLWGLYDMHGNAAEWTASAYDATRRTVRGGSFASRPKDATSSWRWGYEPWQKVYDVGFRVLIEE
ncbi:MAG: SUMF1/EgtB/PvdO family nonheme iron enzyme, partial [Kiritimatiellae bacterium]|nr:SUMF1/EgtB/PvdO family nonheme iron enzyme [Kiritimatiellia bacterium]